MVTGASLAPWIANDKDVEAERCLLACIAHDGSAALYQCRLAGIGADSFSVSGYREFFSACKRLNEANVPIDAAAILQEIPKDILDRLGGVGFITEITSSVPTQAQLGFFITKVSNAARIRSIRLAGQAVLEAAATYTGGDIDEHFGLSQSDLKAAFTPKGSAAMLARLEASRYDCSRRLPDLQPVFQLKGTPVCTRGNISTITAPPKAGKTSTVGAMLAATFLDAGQGGDTFSFIGLNTGAQAVIHFDTEQHGCHHQRMIDTALRRAGVKAPPSWLHSYSRKGAKPEDLCKELEVVLRSKSDAHRGVYAVILDGVADFAHDVNDPKECNSLVTWLEKLAVQYDCAIIGVLHLNPSANRDSVAKARGHLGSQLQRKAETDLRLKKSGDGVSTLFTDPQGTRGGQVAEADGARFAFCPESEMHLSIASKEAQRTWEKANQLREIAKAVWGADESLRYTDIVTRLKEVCHLQKTGAQEKFKAMKDAGVIKQALKGWKLAA